METTPLKPAENGRTGLVALWRFVRLLWRLKHELNVARNWADHHADHASDLITENEQLRRYCGCLEDQLDEYGLKAAQRAAGIDQPNDKIRDAQPLT